jgi:hypothetical protein
MPLASLVFLIFSAVLSHSNKLLASVVLILILSINFYANVDSYSKLVNESGQGKNSWVFYNKIASAVFDDAKEPFGYYTYAPDSYAYAEKAAMQYQELKRKRIDVSKYERKNVTYVIMAPPPPQNLYMKGEWWIENKLKITNKEEKKIRVGNYTIFRYRFNDMETQVTSDIKPEEWLLSR